MANKSISHGMHFLNKKGIDRPSNKGHCIDREPWQDGDIIGQCTLDTSKRTASGIPVYLGVWLGASWATDLWSTHAFLFGINLIGIGAIALIRAVFYFLIPSLVNSNAKLANKILCALIVGNGLYWGILTAMSMISPWGEQVWWVFIVVAAALSSTGTMVMSINPSLRTLYPISLLAPLLAMSWAMDSPKNILVVATVPVLILYIIKTSRMFHVDYWRSLNKKIVSANREQELESLSFTDGLTLVSNRLYFDNRFSDVWAYAVANKARVSLLMIDLDHFKKINDTYGHVFGDQCLKAASLAIRDSVRGGSDSISRFGGEEFAVLLLETDLIGARSTAERILRNIRAVRLNWEGQEVQLRCSIGIALAEPREGDEAVALLRAADEALYRAKMNGRDGLHF
ncbi:MAG: GGDEF domain-containing protein [Rubrivivax sp.]|nr:MAG: GGDEF domain-containing protein [Rubrivivax sp.]